MDKKLYGELIQEIDDDLIFKTLSDMILIKSENPFDEEVKEGFREKEMADFFADSMSRLGLKVEYRELFPGRPNVFGFLEGKSGLRSLMLAGHLDTVRTTGYRGAYDVRIEDGLVYGRGSCDMKAALAAYLETVRLIREGGINLQGSLILAGVVDEEYQLLGSKDIGINGPKADQGIIGEPTELMICPTNKGRVSTLIKTKGKAMHTSVPEKGDNAILRMGRIITALSSYNSELLGRDSHALCGNGRFSLGVIKGGVQVNMVPDYCELEVDRRTLPGETKDQIYRELDSLLQPLFDLDPDFNYEITEPTWFVNPNDISLEEPVVKSLMAAKQEVFGQSPKLHCFPGGSDAPNMGFPTVVCGPGSIAQAHTTCEFVSLEQIVDAVKMYLWSVLDLLS